MAERLTGLIGPGKGLRLHTMGYSVITARVKGLHDGVVKVASESGTLEISESGDYELSPTEFVQFEYDGQSTSLICIILARRAA